MNNHSTKIKWGIIAAVLIIAALFRFIPYIFDISSFNFTPVAAIALFGGAYFSRRYMAFLLPLAVLWISNLVIDNVFLSEYYDGFTIISSWKFYLPILFIVAIGMLLLKKVNVGRVLGASLAASVLFFLVSNFLVWTEGTMYPMTKEGLMQCYYMALPFFGNTIASDLFFSALLFGGFEILKTWKPNLAFVNS